MKKIWMVLGRISFWVTWPGIWLIVRITPPRTRIIIIHDKKLLITQDWLGAGDWSLPGGGLRRGENPAEGAMRELMEETGIKIAPNRCNFIGMKKLKGRGITSHNHCFYIHLTDKPRIYLQRPEILAYKWVSRDELDKVKLSTTVMPVVEAFSNTSNLLQ
ncbi:MAG: NUDIX hydrolase [Candidatus Saccharibacteria bacterium]|nr:NUDIX hydrolase [Candidatus Saccharibacteria bacterium]